MASAAAVIIGNEVLTAKVADTNGPFFIQKLRAWALPVVSIQIVPDDVDAIVEAVGAARRRASWVFTSGGIGPTHDDVTVRAVALALGREVVRLPEMEQLMRSYYAGKPMPEAAMRMAEAPEGGRLIWGPSLKLPVLAADNVFMLPGVPKYFEAQLMTVLEGLPKSQVFSAVLYLSANEAEIAEVLDRVALSLPQVAIGSYPTVTGETSWRVRLTLEAPTPEPVRLATERLRVELPAGSVQRVEGVW